MRYVSNLIAPDLRPYFKLKDPPVQIMGHDIPSDPDFEPECGYFSDDEAAILYHVAKQVGGTWIDVGARFGWTAAHMAEAGCSVHLVDPQLNAKDRMNRLIENLNRRSPTLKGISTITSWTFSPRGSVPVVPRGIVIDGNHDDPAPLNDAMTAHGNLQNEGVILMHDFWGAPIQRAVTWLMDAGYKCRIYSTPNGVALCWRISVGTVAREGWPNGFWPPDHVPDPNFNWKVIRAQRCPDFDFGRCM